MPELKNSVSIKMYRAGTGDFFLLKFTKNKQGEAFFLMIDCGCINAGAETFAPYIKDLKKETKVIDLLVVTHEHADHINGFKLAGAKFTGVTFKKVWFAWTEDENDPIANDLRANHSELALALNAAVEKLNGLAAQGYYEDTFNGQLHQSLTLESRRNFLETITGLSELNLKHTTLGIKKAKPTMAKLLTEYGIITQTTQVEYLSPGELKENIVGLTGFRVFVLGPPKSLALLTVKEKKGESYQKRPEPSTVDFSMVDVLLDKDTKAVLPFECRYELGEEIQEPKARYEKAENAWRKIDQDWLQSAGKLAMRLESSINNTSLALAIQFIDSEKVLLFPGDAEHANWMGWHEKDMVWTIQQGGAPVKVTAEYLLNKTVFYKVGHHMSQNGSAKEKGIEMMTSGELQAMATLHFKMINTGWLNTMPNDLIAAELIAKAKGKLYILGDHALALKNIKTSRVSIAKAHEDVFTAENQRFAGQPFIQVDLEL